VQVSCRVHYGAVLFRAEKFDLVFLEFLNSDFDLIFPVCIKHDLLPSVNFLQKLPVNSFGKSKSDLKNRFFCLSVILLIAYCVIVKNWGLSLKLFS